MKCPNCSTELKYTERPNKTCSKCKQPFALEPRDTPLVLSDLRMRGISERASAQGTRFYTLPQLWYYASRKPLEQATRTMSSGGVAGMIAATLTTLLCGGLSGGVTTGITNSVLAGLIVGLLMVAAILFVTLRSRRSVAAPMPITLDLFRAKVLDPWVQRYQTLPQGLVPDEQLARLRAYQPPPDATRAVLASPERAMLDCLRANGVPERLGLALLEIGARPTAAEERVIVLLRERSALPLLLLHDASAHGCLLARTLPVALGLPASRRVIDLGLRPRTVLRQKLLVTRGDAPKELLGMLERQAANGGGLAREEIDWLRRSATSPVAALAPGQLLNLVTRAVERATSATHQPDPEAQAQAEARGVGFMSWPG